MALVENEGVKSSAAILYELKKEFSNISRITIIRDLNKLVKLNYLKRIGAGRNIQYQLSPYFALFAPVNVEQYFQISPDARVAKDSFNWQIFEVLESIFSPDEIDKLNQLGSIYRRKIEKQQPETAKRELERLIVEFSWKSSVIEGNTYTLLDTERLIKEGKVAKGRKKEEATMILNHKKAFDFLLDNLTDLKKVSVSKIEDVHFLLIKNLDVSRNLRKTPVGIVGTKYRPLGNIHQIRDALEKTCALINQEQNVFAKAIILMLLVAYIQPFTDGNKRVSRLFANGVLMAGGAPPLSLRSIDEGEYKKAVILFYEQNNISYFKQLFIQQLEFSVNN